MKNYKILLRRFAQSIRLFLLCCGMIIFSIPQNNYAYDNDTHFWLTYYLAIKAGYSDVQATQIASANVSVDFDKDTQPVIARFNQIRDL